MNPKRSTRQSLRKIRSLFYNPATDSINFLFKCIERAHARILKHTKLLKGTIPLNESDYAVLTKGFQLPESGLSETEIAKLTADLFMGVPRWHSPHAMYNVAPPPLLQTIAGKAVGSLYNPNLLWDTAAGMTVVAEQRVIKAIAEYIGWDRENAGGSFTFGGKATTLYGIKLGLKKCSEDSSVSGVKEDVVVFSTKACHPSHTSDAEWLGIGSKNLIRLNTEPDGTVDLNGMETAVETALKNEKKVAAIIISGGTTNDMIVDPIKKVVELRNRIVEKLGLQYVPHVHVDAVVGFPWIFFKDYDMKKNPLGMSQELQSNILKIVTNLSGLKYADSFGIDFHKMGFCPYTSSLFMVKDKASFYRGGGNSVKFGQYTPFMYTIENSRSGDGPISAYIALNTLGIKGFQTLIAHLAETAIGLRHTLEKSNQFDVINKTGCGNAVLFVPKVPAWIKLETNEKESVQNKYTTTFLEALRDLGNPFFIDMVPEYSTGASIYPYKTLKAYVMSPYAKQEINNEFVSAMLELKKKIDRTFDFSKTNNEKFSSGSTHPLK